MACLFHLSQAYFLHEITAYLLTTHLGATQFSGASAFSKYKGQGSSASPAPFTRHHNVFSITLHTLTQIIFDELGTPGMCDLFGH